MASIAPGPAAPQWITLEFDHPETVNAVAVFGERIGNDGIRDAQIQVAAGHPGEFRTVAIVGDADSASWIASFAATKTTGVRLRINRSSGPSPHTDLYEIEVYGPQVLPSELRERAAEGLGRCAAHWNELARSVPGEPHLATRARALVDSAELALRGLIARFERWDSLGAEARDQLSSELDRLQAGARRLRHALDRAKAVWPDRSREIAAARRAEPVSATSGRVAMARDGDTLRLSNGHVRLVVNEADGTWDATWLGGVGAAIRRVGFVMEVGGQVVAPAKGRAEAKSFTDAIGSGLEIGQRWGRGGEVVRRIKVYHGRPVIVVSAEIVNNSGRDLSVGTAKLLSLSEVDRGWWQLGDPLRPPAVVGFPEASPPCRPEPDEEVPGAMTQQFSSSAVLALASRGSPGGFVLGALSARQGSPRIRAGFRLGSGGSSLEAGSSLGVVVRPGQVFVIDPVWLSVEENCFDALEHYGDAVATQVSGPVRTGANALWCSWYPIRMGISEEIVLAHAAIAAKHFRPLGMDVMQLDHGWQRGDICGDWFPNERFPHGLKWLSQQLHSRHGMKLGLWIAPTNVAFTSRLFREHPEWLIKDAAGKPSSTGRWFWAPYPEMSLIDASHPGAEKWIEETFARLSAEGASYYKIDFIAGSPALRRAMAAIRRGAGPDAWIRYCQTPPLLSAGPASGAYIGDDTGDAGLADWIRLARANAPLLAASYWANDRLYHREVCDMSVGPKASVEEARFKMSLMALAGCSISFSDDFRTLDPPRIRMMQQCLPPGNPRPRPLDLFERTRPSLWHMHCKGAAGEWEVVGVFNFEDDAQERAVDLASLRLPADAEVAAFEFWEEKFLGTSKGRVTLSLAPRTARVLLLRSLSRRPEVIGTNMHLLGGQHEIERLDWDGQRLRLSGSCRRMPGLCGLVFLYVPEGYRPRPDTARDPASRCTHLGGPLWSMDITFDRTTAEFDVAFDRVPTSR